MPRIKKVKAPVEEVVVETAPEAVVETPVVEEPKKREFLGRLGTQLVVRIRPVFVGPHQIPMNEVLTAEGITYQLSDRDLEAQLVK
jgi:hypothetical protein